jgi:hypothetical protein
VLVSNRFGRKRPAVASSSVDRKPAVARMTKGDANVTMYPYDNIVDDR